MLHPYFRQRAAAFSRAARDRHASLDRSIFDNVRDDPIVGMLARMRGLTPAEIVLARHLNCGVSVNPKASSRKHLADNIAAYQARLDEDDLAALSALNRVAGRAGPDPDTYELAARREA